jgi:hypothetical protein
MRRPKFHGPAVFGAAIEGERMLFGHNTNVTVGGVIVHVQTEDRGANRAVLDTTVHYRGRVLHRRTSKYDDLLPLDPDREQALKVRLDDQHATVVNELRSGKLAVQLELPPPPATVAAPAAPAPSIAPPQEKALIVELLNPRTWLTGKQATLYLVIRDKGAGAVVGDARVSARIDGAAEKTEVSTTTGADGHAQLQFEMPRLGSEDAALVIEAASGEARGQLRFQLKAKPKVPAGG